MIITRKRIIGAGLWVGSLAVLIAMWHFLYVSTAYAAEASQAADATKVTDGGWDLIQNYGVVWGGFLLGYGMLASFLKRNESSHWLKQGRVLAALTGVLMVGASVLDWHFSGASSSGIFVTAALAIQLVISPHVKPTDKLGTSNAGPVIAALTLVGLGFGAVALQTGCATAKSQGAAGVGTFIDCEAANVKAASDELVPLAFQTIQYLVSPDGRTIDTAPLKRAVATIKSDAGKCAIAAAFAMLTFPNGPQAPGLTANASPLSVSPEVARAAFEQLRPGLGGHTFRVSRGVM
jgi:hypothetical protein